MFFKSKPSITSDSVKKVWDDVVKGAVSAQEAAEFQLLSVDIDGNQLRIIIEAPTLLLQRHSTSLESVFKSSFRKLSPSAQLVLVFTNSDAPQPTANTTAKPPAQPVTLPHVGRIIMVTSGKGGVGKSTTTVALAHALTSLGKRVGILDADIYGPSLPRMMGVNTKPDYHDNLLQPLVRHGIACMSMGFLIGQEAAVLRGPMITKALQQMLRGTAWGTQEAPLDILLIDTPPGTGDVAISLAQMIPFAQHNGGALVITTPQEVALDDVRRCVDSLKKLQVPLLGIIENMAYFEDPTGEKHYLFGQGGGAKLAQESGSTLLASLAIQPTFREKLDKGEIIQHEVLASLAQTLLASE